MTAVNALRVEGRSTSATGLPDSDKIQNFRYLRVFRVALERFRLVRARIESSSRTNRGYGTTRDGPCASRVAVVA